MSSNDLVTLPSGAKLAMTMKGPPPRPGEPVVIFEAGQGASGASWAAVQRLLDHRIRSCRYDRAGYGRSPPSEAPRSAAALAGELLNALDAAGVPPPYILAAHSYGAIIAREFLAAAGADSVAGAVLVDANQENTHRKLRVPLAAMDALSTGRNYFDMIGLLRDNDFTPEELGGLVTDLSTPEAAATMSREGAAMLESSDALGARRQLQTKMLGTKPVTVIRGEASRDFGRFLAAAQADGAAAGKEQHVADFVDFVDNRFNVFDRSLQMEQLQLSSNNRFVQATNSGHAVIATEPQLVADEILAVWESSRPSKY